VEVVTPSESVAALLVFVSESHLNLRDSKTLIHILQLALDAMDRCQTQSAAQHLLEFQKKLDNLKSGDPALTAQLSAAAQAILDAINEPARTPPGKPPKSLRAAYRGTNPFAQ